VIIGENLATMKLLGVALEKPKGFLIAKVMIYSIGEKNIISINIIVSVNVLAKMISKSSPESSQTPKLFAKAESWNQIMAGQLNHMKVMSNIKETNALAF
jgi:hypothetical protein